MKRSMRVMLFVMLAAILSLTAITALAQDEGEESPLENACFTGGLWEGKCDWPTEEETEWAWTCGWYVAQFLNGNATAEDIPEWCYFNLPELDVFIEPIILGQCYDYIPLIPALPGWRDVRITGDLADITVGVETVKQYTLEFYGSRDGSCGGGVSLTTTAYYVTSYPSAGNLITSSAARNRVRNLTQALCGIDIPAILAGTSPLGLPFAMTRYTPSVSPTPLRSCLGVDSFD